VKGVVSATEELLAEAQKVSAANTEGYFKNVRLPDVKP